MSWSAPMVLCYTARAYININSIYFCRINFLQEFVDDCCISCLIYRIDRHWWNRRNKVIQLEFTADCIHCPSERYQFIAHTKICFRNQKGFKSVRAHNGKTKPTQLDASARRVTHTCVILDSAHARSSHRTNSHKLLGFPIQLSFHIVQYHGATIRVIRTRK